MRGRVWYTGTQLDDRRTKDNKMAKVFITQEMPYNFAKAERYGDITFLTRKDLNNVKGSLHNAAVMSEIVGKLKEYDESEDWLIITGSPYISAVVFAILGRRGVQTMNVLRWDNRDFDYVPMFIEMKGTNHG